MENIDRCPVVCTLVSSLYFSVAHQTLTDFLQTLNVLPHSNHNTNITYNGYISFTLMSNFSQGKKGEYFALPVCFITQVPLVKWRKLRSPRERERISSGEAPVERKDSRDIREYLGSLRTNCSYCHQTRLMHVNSVGITFNRTETIVPSIIWFNNNLNSYACGHDYNLF